MSGWSARNRYDPIEEADGEWFDHNIGRR